MSKLYFLLLLPCLVFAKTTICLNMIVKDEAPVIERALRSVMPLIDSWAIVDTGSTDGTQDIIKRVLKDIPGTLEEKPWVDFATNRNQALELGKDKADYLLIMDADETISFSSNFSLSNLTADLYGANLIAGGPSVYRNFIVKNSVGWKWEGIIHEKITPLSTPITIEMLNDLLIDATYTDGHRSEDPDKYLKDALMLEKVLADDPNNSDNVYFLAQSYYMAEKYEKAIEAFDRRSKMGAPQELVFFSMLMKGRLLNEIKAPFEEIEKALTTAHLLRPYRAEPLCDLAAIYQNKGDFFQAYLFAKEAAKLPFPSQDTFYVWKNYYDYFAKLIYADAAYTIGKYAEALVNYKEAQLAKSLPDALKLRVGVQVNNARTKLESQLSNQ